MQICIERCEQRQYLVARLGRHDIAADRALHTYADVAEARHVCRDSRQARFDDAVMLDLPMRDGRANVHTVAAADHAFHLTDTIERNDSGRDQSGRHGPIRTAACVLTEAERTCRYKPLPTSAFPRS